MPRAQLHLWLICSLLRFLCSKLWLRNALLLGLRNALPLKLLEGLLLPTSFGNELLISLLEITRLAPVDESGRLADNFARTPQALTLPQNQVAKVVG